MNKQLEQARNQGLSEAAEIVRLCTAAGKPHLAQAYIARRCNADTVRASLADASKERLFGAQQPEVPAGEANATLLERCKAAADSEKAMLRQRHQHMRESGVYVNVAV